jgi:polar amino acid transport system substrate-binding protein
MGMSVNRSLSILRYAAHRYFTTLSHLCSRCSRRSRLWRICLAGVFLWIFVAVGSEPKPAQAADLETIRERGYLIVGVKDTVRPLGFRDSAGVLQGLEIDLARQLAEELIGDRDAIVLTPLDNDERLRAVYDRVDVTIAQVSINPSRERLVQFSLPYWLDGTAILIPDRCTTSTRTCVSPTVTDLSSRTIAVLRDSDAIAALNWQFPYASFVGVESYEAALEQLETGTADAFAGNRSVVIGWAQEYPGYRVLPEYITMRSLAIVLPKGVQYDTLRMAVNDSLESWVASGWLSERIEAWGMVVDGD